MGAAHEGHGSREQLGAVRRAALLQSARRLGVPLPDALLAVVLGVAAALYWLPPEINFYVPVALYDGNHDLIFVVVVEAGFLMLQGSLTDIATRLRKRPPLWSIPLILAALVVVSPYSFGVLTMAWERGGLVLIPLILSLLERAAALWTMPSQPRIRKIAERALVSNRILTGVALFGVATAVMVLLVVLRKPIPESTMFLAVGSVYFAVAEFDEWRVRGKKFAADPRVLFGYDMLGARALDPL